MKLLAEQHRDQKDVIDKLHDLMLRKLLSDRSDLTIKSEEAYKIDDKNIFGKIESILIRPLCEEIKKEDQASLYYHLLTQMGTNFRNFSNFSICIRLYLELYETLLAKKAVLKDEKVDSRGPNLIHNFFNKLLETRNVEASLLSLIQGNKQCHPSSENFRNLIHDLAQKDFYSDDVIA